MQTIQAREQTERCKEKLVELADKEKELEAAKLKLDAAIEDLETSCVCGHTTTCISVSLRLMRMRTHCNLYMCRFFV